MKYKYKLINLDYIINKSDESISKFLRYNGIKKFDKYDIETLKEISKNIINKEDFNVSYNVDRLDKEFDLVKLDDSKLINIELKFTNKDIEQCKRNLRIFKRYYQHHEIYIYCYEKENGVLYIYNEEEQDLNEISFDELNENLNTITIGKILNINIDINSIYLNSDFFLDEKYELSKGQKMTKEKIQTSTKKVNIITGRAGTGKTLLALEIYSDYYFSKKQVIYLAPFKLNDIVSKKLRDYLPMKTVRDFLLSNKKYDIVIIDEAQRICVSEFAKIKERTLEKMFLFGDIHQSIDSKNFFERLSKDKLNNNLYNITQVIRTDDTFDIFSKRVLGYPTSGIKHKRIDKNKIEIYMYSGEALEDLHKYIYLEPAKSLYYDDCTNQCEECLCYQIASKCMNKKVPYDVIGQEYDNVVMFFCNAYKIENNKLFVNKKVCIGNLYNQLYSLMTRAVKSLRIIVMDIDIYNFLSDIKENL